MLTHVEAAGGKFHYSVLQKIGYHIWVQVALFFRDKTTPPPTPIRVRCQYDSIF